MALAMVKHCHIVSCENWPALYSVLKQEDTAINMFYDFFYRPGFEHYKQFPFDMDPMWSVWDNCLTSLYTTLHQTTWNVCYNRERRIHCYSSCSSGSVQSIDDLHASHTSQTCINE